MKQLVGQDPLLLNEASVNAFAADSGNSCPVGEELSPQSQYNRDATAWNVREYAKVRQWNKFIPLTTHPSNRDERDYQTGDKPGFTNRYIASFTKGLPLSQDPMGNGALGEVDQAAYCKLLKAIRSGEHSDFEQVPLGSVDPVTGQPNCPGPNAPRSLENPQAALAYELSGADSHNLFAPTTANPQRIGFPPAPNFDSAAQISEMAELYWMSISRDVAFIDYTTDPIIQAATADLTNYADFRVPKSPGGAVTPDTLYRENIPGCLNGYYLSQFFLRDVPYGAQQLSGKIRPLPAGKDYMSTEMNWLAVQRGCDFNQDCNLAAGEPLLAFMRNGRDLAQFVHVDNVYYSPFNA